MDLSRYSLIRTTADIAWDRFVDASPQGTLFSESVFLSALNAPPGLWFCNRGEEICAAVALIESADGVVAYPNVIYNGIMFAPPSPKQNDAQVLSEQFRILSFLSSALAETYGSLCMTLEPSLIDLRPFLWHNYHNDDPKYAVDLRYTNMIDLRQYEAHTNMADTPGYAAANKSRRQELRYALNRDYTTKEGYDPDLFLNMYRETFARQDKSMAGTGIEDLPRILSNLHTADRLRMFVTSTAEGVPGAIGIFARDSKRWYYQFGASNPDIRDGHAGSLMLWDAMVALSASGPHILDMEGVNSPQRGYYKLSYGGSLTPYYRLRFSAG